MANVTAIGVIPSTGRFRRLQSSDSLVDGTGSPIAGGGGTGIGIATVGSDSADYATIADAITGGATAIYLQDNQTHTVTGAPFAFGNIDVFGGGLATVISLSGATTRITMGTGHRANFTVDCSAYTGSTAVVQVTTTSTSLLSETSMMNVRFILASSTGSRVAFTSPQVVTNVSAEGSTTGALITLSTSVQAENITVLNTNVSTTATMTGISVGTDCVVDGFVSSAQTAQEALTASIGISVSTRGRAVNGQSSNFGVGAVISGADGIIQNCNITNYYSHGLRISSSTADHARFDNNILQARTTGTSAIAVGVTLAGGSGLVGVTISNNTIKNGVIGINVGGEHDLSILNNHIENTVNGAGFFTMDNCILIGSPENLKIVGNTFRGTNFNSGGVVINVTSCIGLLVTHNTYDNFPTQNHFSIAAGSRYTFKDNFFITDTPLITDAAQSDDAHYGEVTTFQATVSPIQSLDETNTTPTTIPVGAFSGQNQIIKSALLVITGELISSAASDAVRLNLNKPGQTPWTAIRLQSPAAGTTVTRQFVTVPTNSEGEFEATVVTDSGTPDANFIIELVSYTTK